MTHAAKCAHFAFACGQLLNSDLRHNSVLATAAASKRTCCACGIAQQPSTARARATNRHGDTDLVEFESGFFRDLEVERDLAPDHDIDLARGERRRFDTLGG